MFWAPNGLNQLPEVRFEFLFILIGQSIMAFLTGQSWRVLRFWYTGWCSEQGFRRCFADSLPRRRFQGSSHFVPPHKRLLNREQHSFPKAQPITLNLPNSGRLTLTAGYPDNYTIYMKHWESFMTSNKFQTQGSKNKIKSNFRILHALHNLSEGKKRKVDGNSRVTFLHYHESFLAWPFNAFFQNY